MTRTSRTPSLTRTQRVDRTLESLRDGRRLDNAVTPRREQALLGLGVAREDVDGNIRVMPRGSDRNRSHETHAIRRDTKRIIGGTVLALAAAAGSGLVLGDAMPESSESSYTIPQYEIDGDPANVPTDPGSIAHEMNLPAQQP